MRFVPLDRLRALAVLSMVQGHTFSVLLAEGALPGAFMRVHALLHGLTAPAFLFGAGLAFGLATYPRYRARRHDRATLFFRLRRYAGLLLLGYALQLPGGSLLAALRLEGAALRPVLQVGPLHLIALCLTLSELATRLIESARRHAQWAALCAAAVALAAPSVWALQLQGSLAALLGPWLAGHSGSLFPVFPWASFALLGQACAYPLARLDAGPPRRSALYFASAGVALAALSYVLFVHGVRLSAPSYFWHTSPLYLLFRLGLVLTLLAALHLGATPDRARTRATQSSCAVDGAAERTSTTALLARHSLTAYVTHLLVLYGTPFTPSLQRRFGASLSALQTALAFVLLLGLTLLIVRAIAWLRTQREYGWVQVGLTVLVLATLVR